MPNSFDPLDPLNCLPTELLIYLVSYLDSYSIQALINAFPWLKVLCVLITDHHALDPIFFDVPGVKRMPSLESGLAQLAAYDPMLNKQPIKLVELCSEKSLWFLSSIDLKGGHIGDNIVFDSTTFVFLDSRNMYITGVNYARMINQHGSNCKFHYGLPRNFGDSTLKLPEGQHSFSSSTATSFITSLHIDGVDTFTDHQMPPLLRDFAISLNRAHIDEQGSYVYPEVSNLNFFAIPHNFRVQYTGDLPHLYGLSYTHEDPTGRKPELVRNLFEISDTLSMNKKSLPYLKNNPSKDHGSVKLELGFIHNYAQVSLLGVPYHFFCQCNFTYTRQLTWDVSSNCELSEATIHEFRNLYTLSISVDEPGVTLPVLKSSLSVSLQNMVLNVFAPNVDVSNLLHNISQSAMGRTSIYRSLSLLKSHGSITPALMTDAQWFNWFKTQSEPIYSDTFELVGFQMPFLYTPLELQAPGANGTPGVPIRSKSIKLQPVITLEEYHTHFQPSDKMVINGLNLKGYYDNTVLKVEISPIMMPRDASKIRPMTLVIDLGVTLLPLGRYSWIRMENTLHFNKFYYRDQEFVAVPLDDWSGKTFALPHNRHLRRTFTLENATVVKHEWKEV